MLRRFRTARSSAPLTPRSPSPRFQKAAFGTRNEPDSHQKVSIRHPQRTHPGPQKDPLLCRLIALNCPPNSAQLLTPHLLTPIIAKRNPPHHAKLFFSHPSSPSAPPVLPLRITHQNPFRTISVCYTMLHNATKFQTQLLCHPPRPAKPRLG